MPVSKSYTDHLGVTYESISDMARAWNIPPKRLLYRLSKNIPIEQALTMSTEDIKSSKLQCQDHLGNVYPSKRAMCEAYGITTSIFFSRMGNLKWSLEKSLTTPLVEVPETSIAITDHLGQEFPSINAMCKHWKVARSTFRLRTEKKGWSVERALTEPVKQTNSMRAQHWTDHLGNDFPSLNAMCEAWGITHHTFSTRVNRLGWSVEKALTTPTVINASECSDEMGHIFPTIGDMCHYYNIPSYYLQGKTCTGNTLRKRLLSNFRKDSEICGYKIKKCVEFPYYLVSKGQSDYILTLEQLLDLYHNDNFHPIPNRQDFDEFLHIGKCIEFPYYEVKYKGVEYIWTYWSIIQYRRDTNFGLSSHTIGG